MNSSHTVGHVGFLLILLSSFFQCVSPSSRLRKMNLLPSIPFSSSTREQITFTFLGDWGYLGENQTIVANSMSNWVEEHNASFVIALGDNFYKRGVDNDTDPLWKTVYEDVYSMPPLQRIPWYAILGNHDYRKNPEAQIDYTLNHRDHRWTMPAHEYHRIYPITANITLEMILIDTLFIAPLEANETTPTGKNAVSDDMRKQHLNTIEQFLASSTATWLVVAGHYPVFSMAEHGDTDDLITYLEPLLQKYHVNAYINGHDHVLQHLSWHGVEYFTCGHGTLTNQYPLGYFPSESNLPNENGDSDPEPSHAVEGFRFGSIGPGFGSAVVTKDTFTIQYYDRNGNELYSFMLTNPRDTTTTNSSPVAHKPRHLSRFAILLITVIVLGLVSLFFYILAFKRAFLARLLRSLARFIAGSSEEHSTHEMEIRTMTVVPTTPRGVDGHEVLSVSRGARSTDKQIKDNIYSPISIQRTDDKL